MENKNLISYSTFLQDMLNFKKAGTRGGSDFNYTDTPSHSYFKLLFYFHNNDTNETAGGLLAPTWQVATGNYYMYNSAWAYLMQNGEHERAEKLEQFITLLSDINSESPWYFSEVSGVDEALNRALVTSNEFKLDESRKKISIKCLPDAVDQRIGTLLSLYRDVTWSWIMKREIIPANLRKFDMAIYIWESPMYSLTTDAKLNEDSSEFSSSYRMIEFHNCEIDYNSIKSGLGTLTNKEGAQHEYTIDIMFDDCYERNYNAFMMRTIGDMIMYDSGVGESKAQDKVRDIGDELWWRMNEAETRMSYWVDYSLSDDYTILYPTTLPGHPGSRSNSSGGALNNAINEVGGMAKEEIKSVANRLFLGNLYTYSISKLSDQLKGVLRGQVFNTMKAVDDYTGSSLYNDVNNKYSLSNLANRGQSYLNKVALDRKTGANRRVQTLGNLYKSNTLINNL